MNSNGVVSTPYIFLRADNLLTNVIIDYQFICPLLVLARYIVVTGGLTYYYSYELLKLGTSVVALT